jgi:lipopolysaccharide/colanic/teichoic acid biosynthesis glycosyltransferase
MGGQILVKEEAYVESTQQAEIDHFSTFQYQVIKRAFDLLLAAVGLPFCVLIGAPAALVIRLSSPGPIFYREYRLGQYGKHFRIWKFRTMYTKDEQRRQLSTAIHTSFEFRSTHKHLRDPRITPVGRVLRRWSIDELPQILNVLKGEMSFIGPRPIVDAERQFYDQDFHYYCMVRPGLSGLWQVSGRNNVDYGKRVLLDRRYAQEWSLALDLVILSKTFRAVMSSRGAY